MSGNFLDSLDNGQTKYAISLTAQFRKDYKLARKRGLKIEALAEIVTLLANGKELPEKNRDHSLSGNWAGIGSAIFSRIGCSSTVLQTMFWC